MPAATPSSSWWVKHPGQEMQSRSTPRSAGAMRPNDEAKIQEGCSRMVVPDAYRAQLYLRRLILGLRDLETALGGLGVARHDVDAALDGLTRSITRELDSILLPTVALELAIARRLDLLQG